MDTVTVRHANSDKIKTWMAEKLRDAKPTGAMLIGIRFGDFSFADQIGKTMRVDTETTRSIAAFAVMRNRAAGEFDPLTASLRASEEAITAKYSLTDADFEKLVFLLRADASGI